MGLDITAYRGLVKVANPELDEYGSPVDWQSQWLAHPVSIGWAETHFPGRSAGIEPGAVYTFAETMRFRAGSYGGYNQWRSHLAEMAGYSEGTAGPFSELINFADNEGVIGPVVAAKLAADFREHEQRADEYAKKAGDWWLDKYRLWRRAFEMAADGGAVDFH